MLPRRDLQAAIESRNKEGVEENFADQCGSREDGKDEQSNQREEHANEQSRDASFVEIKTAWKIEPFEPGQAAPPLFRGEEVERRFFKSLLDFTSSRVEARFFKVNPGTKKE